MYQVLAADGIRGAKESHCVKTELGIIVSGLAKKKDFPPSHSMYTLKGLSDYSRAKALIAPSNILNYLLKMY